MAGRTSRLCARTPRLILGLLVLLTIALGAYAVGVPDRLALGGGELAGSESAEADRKLAAELGYEPGAAYVLVLTESEPLPTATVDIVLETLAIQIEAIPGVRAVSEGERADGGGIATLGVHLAPDASADTVATIGNALEGGLDAGPLEVLVGGSIPTQAGARETAGGDVPRLAALVTPLLLLLLAGALGPRPGLAALLALLLGAAGTVAALGLIGELADLQALAAVVGAMLGAVLAVQAAAGLLLRYREESVMLGAGAEALEYSLHLLLRAAVTGMFSAALVGAALLFIPIDFVRSVGVAVIVAALLGPPLGLLSMAAGIGLKPDAEVGEALPIVPDGARVEDAPRSFRALFSLGRTRSGGLVAVLPLLAIAALVLPVLDSEAIGLSATELPSGQPAAEADARLAGAFGPGAGGPLQVVAEGPLEASTVTIYRDAIARLVAIEAVSRAVAAGPLVSFEAAPAALPQSLAAQRAADDVRSVPAPSPRHVGGQAAELGDSARRLGDDLPLVGIFALLGTAALWSLLFRSVFGPALALTALIAPLAGIAAMIGVFSEGRLTDLLDYPASGAPHLQSFVVVGAVLLALGLARGADLASALREERMLGGGVAGSLARSNLLTLMPIALASLVGIVLAGVWAGSELLGAKEMAVGLVGGLLADLLLARLLLAPALARLAI